MIGDCAVLDLLDRLVDHEERNKEPLTREDRILDRILNNELYWLPGQLLSWWQEVALGTCRSYQEICHDWAMANKMLMLHGGKSEMPERPGARHLRRRVQSAKKMWR